MPATGVSAEWAFGGAAGAGVDVVVVDSGIDASHPAVGGLAGGAALHWDAGAQRVVTVEGPHDDLFGHGTACAGIIRRAAPDARLHSVRVLGERLTGKGLVFAEGLRWAVRSGARVVNLSLSSSSQELHPLFHDVADEAYFAGVVLVCAVNNVRRPSFPSQYAAVVSVAANDATGPFDIDCNPHPPVEFGAPGIDVEVAWPGGGTLVTTGNSFAAPHVTGLVARLLSKHPELSPPEVKAVLRAVSRNAVPAVSPT
ncbi:subtilase family protein [Motilibacter peucedani]|uniref:Subtilase family protein n=1 Tax=Motilibacter peucedani TaxID=598650 RepID=A0A420XK59_9ACTN|nr:S8 family serine peptidase [Motilibacter peucedani]RKS68010.1 subtilase family protein [Motilibacter peucedani]